MGIDEIETAQRIAAECFLPVAEISLQLSGLIQSRFRRAIINQTGRGVITDVPRQQFGIEVEQERQQLKNQAVPCRGQLQQSLDAFMVMRLEETLCLNPIH